jgi:5'-3' exonuclease
MGIPYYFYTLTKSYGNILSNTIPCNPDIYCLDFNGIIHPLCGKIISESTNVNEESMIEKLYDKVKLDIDTLKPKKTLICVDGVVPLAKMIQQRRRRYLSAYRNKIDNVDVKWDTNCITPGTKFMKNLNTYFKKQVRYNSLPSQIIYSGSDEYGEGEHKIFNLLQSEHESSSVIINGLDADLIILCLMSHRKDIYLMREADTNTYVNIENLRKAIIEELTKKWNIQPITDIYSNEATDVIESYCVMCSVLGNDFIPHLLTLNLKSNGLEKLISCTGTTYKTQGLLVNDSTINYMALSDILQQLAKNEDRELFEETERYLKKTSQSHIPSEYYAIKNKDPIAETIYKNISKWHQTYYKTFFHTNITIDSSVISNVCECFITGIYWTYAYYKKKHFDNTWYYPYEYPPSVKDIANYTLGNDAPIMKDNTVQLTTNMQLMIVLPIDSKHLLDEKYQKMMEDQTLGLYHLYPRSYKIHTYLKIHLWECTPILPIININYVIKHIS